MLSRKSVTYETVTLALEDVFNTLKRSLEPEKGFKGKLVIDGYYEPFATKASIIFTRETENK